MLPILVLNYMVTHGPCKSTARVWHGPLPRGIVHALQSLRVQPTIDGPLP